LRDMPLARGPQHNGSATISQGLAALRDFHPAYDRSGVNGSRNPDEPALTLCAQEET
jgi:hypothetical protein